VAVSPEPVSPPPAPASPVRASPVPVSVTFPAGAEAFQQRVRSFIAESVIPLEQEAFVSGVDDRLRIRLQDAARAAGVLAPQAASEFGYSPLGPLAINCAAPDEGNMHLLAMVGSAGQQQRYLRPLVAGRVRSCFAMTEPPPGAGSDPAALRSTARRTRGGWVLNGDKQFITGADGAVFAIVMARAEGPGAPQEPGAAEGPGTAGGPGAAGGATMFLVDADNPGWQVGGRMRTIDAGTVGGHCHVRLRDLFVTDDAVLGEAGRGFAHAQVRLVPARLTHCMRWLGAAQRAHDVALRRAADRQLFGAPLGSLGLAQQLIADNEIDLVASRALLWQTVAQVAQDTKGTEESSRAKVFISEATGRIVDRAVQLAGGAGVTEESVIGRIYADIRAFRIYDGPSEAHRAAIARKALARVQRAST
jgi:acyl-CoA dehydrogenase